MSSPVFVCTSSYGARYVEAHGQSKAVELSARAGAKGIEIRQELFGPLDTPLEALAETIKTQGLACHYSTTELVWLGDRLNDNLHTSIETALQLGASLLKVAIGKLPQSPEVQAQTLSKLANWLEGSSLTIAIENDQTPDGGLPDELLKAYAAFQSAGIDTGLVVDTGNWQWVGVNPTEAARKLGKKVCYVHCKGVKKDGQNLHAVAPSAAELAQWSSYWGAFPANVPRAIEFPLADTDTPDNSESSLVSNTSQWVERLSHL
ncbi:hypothetical protein LMG33818_001328 [Halomonadaceae bacterium LMG 33818]|uniref:sugar phosphate isomerase/epimerase family protein n=1 Tax=Cernens ardua TaxID=3402176 RepID=UPI003EDC5100